jgi:hypothetical protein
MDAYSKYKEGAYAVRFMMQYEPRNASGVLRKDTFALPAKSLLVLGKGTLIKERSLFGSLSQSNLALNGTFLLPLREPTCLSLPSTESKSSSIQPPRFLLVGFNF